MTSSKEAEHCPISRHMPFCGIRIWGCIFKEIVQSWRALNIMNNCRLGKRRRWNRWIMKICWLFAIGHWKCMIKTERWLKVKALSDILSTNSMKARLSTFCSSIWAYGETCLHLSSFGVLQPPRAMSWRTSSTLRWRKMICTSFWIRGRRKCTATILSRCSQCSGSSKP